MAHVFICRCHSKEMQGARIGQTDQAEWKLAPAVNEGIVDIIQGTKDHRAYRLSCGWDEKLDRINTFHELADHKDTYAVEVHFNSSSFEQRKGYFAMAWHTSVVGQQLARCILKELVAADVGTRNLGVNLTNGRKLWLGRPWEYESHRGSFVKKTNCPAVLIETGFLTNSRDITWIQNEQRRIDFGWAIGRGIVNFLTEVKI